MHRRRRTYQRYQPTPFYDGVVLGRARPRKVVLDILRNRAFVGEMYWRGAWLPCTGETFIDSLIRLYTKPHVVRDAITWRAERQGTEARMRADQASGWKNWRVRPSGFVRDGSSST